MPTPTLKNAGGLPFLALSGVAVLRRRQMSDGDTLAFAALKPYAKGPVACNVPVDASGAKSVNVRLQSIDAPEKGQPMGAASRDSLLARFGFKPAALGLDEADFSASGPTTTRPAWLLTHGLDGNQRPLGYVFWRDTGLAHGSVHAAGSLLALLRRSANLHQCSRGMAYPAFYDNTDEAHALLFQQAAAKARAAQRGVWAVDRSASGFEPRKAALSAPGGGLIYPKFFRRIEKWPAQTGKAADFIAWLKKQSDGRKLVIGARREPTRLWELFEARGPKRVAVPYDVSKLWWSE